MPTTSSKRRIGACVDCNKRKIKCEFKDGWEENGCCDACAGSGIVCVPRSRKKRKVISANARDHSWSTEVIVESHGDHALPYQSWAPATGQWESAGSLSGEGPPQMASHALAGSCKQTTTDTSTYIGGSHYLTHDLPIDETSARAHSTSKDKEPSETQVKTLEIWGCSLLPPKAVRQSLVESFMQRCYPWSPVFSPEDIETERPGKQPSLLLNQALFVAASRVLSSPGVAAFASSEQFYQRAKALFWLGHEKNILTVIAATTMLQWYNPDGPEHVSFDTSKFWLQIGVGLAHQMGLHKEPTPGADCLMRRRLWWSLVARDCLISSGQGRPRVINVKDSDIRPLCLKDFPNSRAQGELFIPYVEICILLGDLTECRSRKHMPRSKKLYLESALYRWIKTLPETLRLARAPNTSNIFTASTSDFNARQLHLPYLIALTIMARSMTSYPPKQEYRYTSTPSTISAVAILASSFVAGIFEEFLARDELQYLGPIFTFYLLASGITLVSTHRDSTLWCIAKQDLEVLQNSLQELSKRWSSARVALKGLRNIIERAATRTVQGSNIPTGSSVSIIPQLGAEQKALLEDFPHDLCRLWSYFSTSQNPQQQLHSAALNSNANVHSQTILHVPAQPQGPITEHMTAEILGNLRYPPSPPPAHALPEEPRPCVEASLSLPMLDNFGDPGSGGTGGDGDCDRGGNGSVADHDYQYAGMGDWLFSNWETDIAW